MRLGLPRFFHEAMKSSVEDCERSVRPDQSAGAPQQRGIKPTPPGSFSPSSL